MAPPREKPLKTASKLGVKQKIKRAKSTKGIKAPAVLTPEVLEADYKPIRGTEPDDESETLADEDLAPEFDAEFHSETSTKDSANLPTTTSSIEVDPVIEAEKALATTTLDPGQKDLLKQYLREVSRYPLLSADEELRLALKLLSTGDVEVARQLVRANLRLVVKIAMEYRSAYQNVLDLIQEGNVGLMKAVSKFDPSKGAKLSYYSSWWIRSYILKYILDNFRLVRLGTTQAQKKLFFQLMREKEKLEAQGLDSGPKLLATRLNVREQDVVEMEQRLSGLGAEMSLDLPVKSGSEDSNKGTFLDLLPDHSDSPDRTFEQAQLQEILKSKLGEFADTLKDKELAVFNERLAAEDPKTLQEVADKFGLTRERVRQIEVKVIEKLKDFYKSYIR